MRSTSLAYYDMPLGIAPPIPCRPRERSVSDLSYRILPWHLQDPFREYFADHTIQPGRMGGFLRAVLEGDFEWAIELADCTAAAGLPRVKRFLLDAPTASHGSPLNVRVWLALRRKS